MCESISVAERLQARRLATERTYITDRLDLLWYAERGSGTLGVAPSNNPSHNYRLSDSEGKNELQN